MKSPALPLELVPIEPAAASPPDAAVPPPQQAAPPPQDVIEVSVPARTPPPDLHGAVPSTDRFAREAAQQYAEGHIDQPLWDRAVAQSNGDQDAAVRAYLRARATALRLIDRQARQGQRAPAGARPAAGAPRPPPAEGSAPADDEMLDEDAFDPSSVGFKRKRIIGKYRSALIAGGVAVPLLLLAAWFFGGRNEPPATTAAVSTAPRAPAAAPVAAPAPAKAADAKTVNADFMQKLQQFRDTGNWNMVVLYAVEWTRREPASAAAWNELRAGYVNLRQYDDALAAAKKAVELAPAEAPLWRHLGNAQLDLDDPAAALASFTEAAARDPGDAFSLQQIGLLHARQGRMPEAKSAFEQALVAQPGDPLTTCLKAGLAQLAPQKDPHAAALQVRTLDAKCRGNELEVAPAAPPAAATPPASGAGKRAAPRS